MPQPPPLLLGDSQGSEQGTAQSRLDRGRSSTLMARAPLPTPTGRAALHVHSLWPPQHLHSGSAQGRRGTHRHIRLVPRYQRRGPLMRRRLCCARARPPVGNTPRSRSQALATLHSRVSAAQAQGKKKKTRRRKNHPDLAPVVSKEWQGFPIYSRPQNHAQHNHKSHP
jgi:hypothetical protein